MLNLKALWSFFSSLNPSITFPTPTKAPANIPSLAPTPEFAFDLSPPPTPLPYNCSAPGLGGHSFVGSCFRNNVLEVAREKLELSLFVSLYEILGLEPLFDCSGPFTAVFPTNKAVIALGRERLTELLAFENREQLQELLFYHVIPGEINNSTNAVGYVTTLTPTETVLVGNGASTFDSAVVQTGDAVACNGRVLTIDTVLEPGSQSPSFSPSSRPTSSPTTLAPSTATPSVAPTAAPTESLHVLIDRFYIAYSSQNATEPSLEEYELLQEVTKDYYTEIFTSNFTDFLSLDFEIEFTLHDQGFPRFDFNIYSQWLPSVFTFRPGAGVSPEQIVLTLRRGVTLEYLLRVRALSGTAFADAVQTLYLTQGPGPSSEEQIGMPLLTFKYLSPFLAQLAQRCDRTWLSYSSINNCVKHFLFVFWARTYCGTVPVASNR